MEMKYFHNNAVNDDDGVCWDKSYLSQHIPNSLNSSNNVCHIIKHLFLEVKAALYVTIYVLPIVCPSFICLASGITICPSVCPFIPLPS